MNRLVFVLSLFSLFLFPSCKKQAAICSGNCGEITAAGKVVNELTGTPVSGVPVSLAWTKFSGGIEKKEVIGTVQSNDDGSFILNATLDTMKFNDGYTLYLSAESNDEYMILGYSGTIGQASYSFDPTAFANLRFDVYRKAALRIRLHRILNDDFKSFSISHSNVVPELFQNDYLVQSPQEVINRNQSYVDKKTVADIYTRIRTEKVLPDGTTQTTVDSVICGAAGETVYDVFF